MRSLVLTRRSSLRVATTVPTILARIILNRGASPLGLPYTVARSARSPFSLCDRGLADGKRVFEVGVRTRDDVHRHELAHAPRGGRACVRGGLHGGDVAAHDRRHVPGA